MVDVPFKQIVWAVVDGCAEMVGALGTVTPKLVAWLASTIWRSSSDNSLEKIRISEIYPNQKPAETVVFVYPHPIFKAPIEEVKLALGLVFVPKEVPLSHAADPPLPAYLVTVLNDVPLFCVMT